MRGDPRSGESPDAAYRFQRSKLKWEDALGLLEQSMKERKESL